MSETQQSQKEISTLERLKSLPNTFKIMTGGTNVSKSYAIIAFEGAVIVALISVIVCLVLGVVAFVKTNKPSLSEEGSFNITWNISDSDATAMVTEKWLYSKVGNVVVVKGSGFLTLMSITADSNTRYFVGKGLPTKLLPGPTSEVYILVAVQGDEYSNMYTGVVNFKNINIDPNNIGQLTLNKSTYYADGWMSANSFPFIPPTSTTVGVRPYSFSYKIG
jgi:hypothetical protein